MKNTPLLQIAIIIVFLSCACTRPSQEEALLPELSEVENIMYEHPDSALHLLQQMPVPPATAKLQQATWALFMTQAKYKNYVKQNDSLINIALKYFIEEGRGNTQRKALTYYYKAAVCHEHQQLDEAQHYYLKAATEVDQTDDYLLGYLIYAGLGTIYAYGNYPDYALKTYAQAYDYAQKGKSHNQIISSNAYLARVYGMQKDSALCIKYYQTGIQIAKEYNEYMKQAALLAELGAKYRDFGDYVNGLKYIKRSLAIEYQENQPANAHSYFTLGELYRKMGMNDSAHHYFLLAENIPSNIYTQWGIHDKLYTLAKGRKDYKKALHYLELAEDDLDSIRGLNKTQAFIEMQEKYDQQKVINEKNLLLLEKSRITRNSLLVVCMLLVVMAFLVYRYQKRLLKKERTIQETEKKLNESIVQLQENEKRIRKNLEYIEELNRRLEKSKNLHEQQIEEHRRELAEMQEQNERLGQENVQLQKNIQQYSSVLREKSTEMEHLRQSDAENQRLRSREKQLTELLIERTESLSRLRAAPKYVEVHQWREILKDFNQVFDNYTVRLQQRVSTLTDNDLQMCSLIKLQLSNPNIATLLGISSASVARRKLRLKDRILASIGSLGDCRTLDLWLWDF